MLIVRRGQLLFDGFSLVVINPLYIACIAKIMSRKTDHVNPDFSNNCRA